MTWFRCIDKSGGSAVLGHKTITQNGTYNASSDNLDGYDQVIVNVPSGGLPSWITYTDVTPTESTEVITVPYDNTKTLLNALIYINLPTLTSYRTQTGLCGHKKVNDTNMVRLGATGTDYQGNDVYMGYGSVTVDDVNGTVTFTGRGDNYTFKHDIPYRVIFLYSEV